MNIGDEGLRLIVSTPEYVDRFWSKVDRRGPDECWLWTGKAKHKFGYGAMNVRGFVCTSHRIAFAVATRDLPAGAHVLHKCDVPGCCNPNHLYAGTNDQNRADMVARGRSRKGGHTPEVIAKIKAARAANPPVVTPEGRAARSEALRRRWQDPAWRAKFSEMMSGDKNPLFGKPPSPERMANIVRAAKARKGFKHSDETKEKIRQAARNRSSAG